MPYITVRQSPRYHQLSLEEILAGSANIDQLVSGSESDTRTYFAKKIPAKLLERFDFEQLTAVLEEFVAKHEGLYQTNRAELYTSFKIPKRSGGLRTINAPVDELKTALIELRAIFFTKFGALYHTNAFAYIEGRSTVDAVKKHQANESKWFLHTDFSDFFGSTTLEFLMSSLSTIFPFSEVVKTERGYQALSKSLSLCMLNGGLPQGTPISPMLTNLMMIPIDHHVANQLRNYQDFKFIYTRYADDCTFSSRIKFDPDMVVDFIHTTLKQFTAPFFIKPEKTHFGSNAGRNWMLGLMLNKDNQVTVGHRNKKRMRAMICNYILDRKSNVLWPVEDVQSLHGLINYYIMVEPQYMEEVIKYNNEKFDFDLISSLLSDISQNTCAA